MPGAGCRKCSLRDALGLSWGRASRWVVSLEPDCPSHDNFPAGAPSGVRRLGTCAGTDNHCSPVWRGSLSGSSHRSPVAKERTAVLFGLVGVGMLNFARTGNSVMPLALFTIVIVSYAHQPREDRPTDERS